MRYYTYAYSYSFSTFNDLFIWMEIVQNWLNIGEVLQRCSNNCDFRRKRSITYAAQETYVFIVILVEYGVCDIIIRYISINYSWMARNEVNCVIPMYVILEKNYIIWRHKSIKFHSLHIQIFKLCWIRQSIVVRI